MTSDQQPTTGHDPYLWLEDVTGESALDWVRQHNAVTEEQLTDNERFDRLQSDVREILDTDARIPYVRRRGEFLYNFWRDSTHVRGLWRRTTFDQYVTDDPEWDVLVDLDALAEAEGENWVWKGTQLLRPHRNRALISLSRGGADAAVVREFDIDKREFLAPEGENPGFYLPEAKTDIDWIDIDTVYVGTDIGPGSLTDSGYPRLAQRWKRGTPSPAPRPSTRASPRTWPSRLRTIRRPGSNETSSLARSISTTLSISKFAPTVNWCSWTSPRTPGSRFTTSGC
ncbi:hypothetical protein GCM10020255_060350 [Rhodococcus baikonurensis]